MTFIHKIIHNQTLTQNRSDYRPRTVFLSLIFAPPRPADNQVPKFHPHRTLTLTPYTYQRVSSSVVHAGIVAIDGGMYHSMALKDDGTVWMTGLNGNGQLGDGTTTTRNTFFAVKGLSGQ